MSCQFMFTCEYNDFNNGRFITKNVPIILFCTFCTLIAVLLTAGYLYQDNAKSRLGLVISSASMFVAAIFLSLVCLHNMLS